MRAAAGATFAMLIGFAGAGLAAGSAWAGEDDAYYPAAAPPRTGPLWERPRSTRFSATRCSAGGPAVDQLTINREAASDLTGLATYSDAAKDKGFQQGAGGWALAGDQLKVSGDGFELEGRWVGAILTATITRPQGGTPVRCRFQVTALRSFTEYQ